MVTQDLIKKVRKIEIKTRGLSSQVFSGEYHSAFKGRGMAFAEVREYQPGDDIRTIDWNVTARFNHPFVKVFHEERELTVMIAVDLSGSESFGTHVQFKKDLIIELCAVLAFSAIQNNDKVGVIFFTDKIEKFIPPKKGRTHILRIIRELIEFKPASKGTNIKDALRYLNMVIKKKCTAFIISDFIDEGFAETLKITNKKHDLVAIAVNDKTERELPDVGLIKLFDAESGQEFYLDTSIRKNRSIYLENAIKRKRELEDAFRKAGVDAAFISTGGSYITPLMNLFKKREGR